MESRKKEIFYKLILPPVCTLVLLLIFSFLNDIYPLGKNSLSWSDLSNQFVPLLNQFKDILDGRSSLFLNFANACGINFYGVFLYYLSSPFSLLVKFVPKADMFKFINILFFLKISLCAFTAACAFCYIRRELDEFTTIILSITYAFCGYNFMYYQIFSWLDMVYLFPLLLVSLVYLANESKFWPYVLVLSVSFVVHYYISYMFVIFIICFILAYCYFHSQEERVHFCKDIFVGSFLAALITALVWLPVLYQFGGSGRSDFSLIETIYLRKLFFHDYVTSWPLLLATALPFSLIVIGLWQKNYNPFFSVLLVLTAVPFVLEPVNIMWHGGPYMCFPCRFSFITIFLALLCASYSVDTVKVKLKKRRYWVSLLIFALLYACYKYVQIMLAKAEVYDYTITLNGDTKYFLAMTKVFLGLFLSYASVYVVFKRGYISKYVYMIVVSGLFLCEFFFNADVYVARAAKEWKEINDSYVASYTLEDKITADHFFRVKVNEDVYSNGNYVGAIGYNSISHYGSLSNRNYLRLMKNMGYGGVWVTSCPFGGTRLTDAILAIEYIINEYKDDSQNEKILKIERLPESMPLGIIVPKDRQQSLEKLPRLTNRTQYQDYFSRVILGESVVKEYLPDIKVEIVEGKYSVNKDSILTYNLKIAGEESLYWDVFDNKVFFDMDLRNGLEVSVNGQVVESDYPLLYRNGLLHLGDYKDEDVSVSLRCKKDIKCASWGLISLDVVKLRELVSKVKGAQLNVKGSGLSGRCLAEEDCLLFVSIPYSDDYTVKVNGQKVTYRKALGSFISFDLSKGDNDIEITFRPKGLVLGLLISSVGILLLVVCVKFAHKMKEWVSFDRMIQFVVITISSLVFIIVYVVPVLIKIFFV